MSFGTAEVWRFSDSKSSRYVINELRGWRIREAFLDTSVLKEYGIAFETVKDLTVYRDHRGLFGQRSGF